MGSSADGRDELLPLSYSPGNFLSRKENASREILNIIFL